MEHNEFEVISPINNEIIHRQAYSTEGEINQALENSSSWPEKTLDERISILNTFLERFQNQADKIANDICMQMGRPLKQAYGEINGVVERATYLIGIAKQQLEDEVIDNTHLLRKYPLGKVFIIAPWNYPYLTAINSIIPALLCGNEIILKHSSQTPLCGKLLQETLHNSGVPIEAFNTLYLNHKQTMAVINHRAIQFVSFTGSVNAGYQLQKTLSNRFIRRSFELGGKDPAIVLEGCNLELTVENLVDGAFFNSGQSCCAVERIYVQDSCFEAFTHAFVDATKQYVLNDPRLESTNLGPMVNVKSANFVRSQIEQAKQQGAHVHIHETDFIMSQPDSPYLAPQVLTNVNHTMKIMQEESFGPVVGIMPFKTISEAIELANDSQYGLTASIWSNDIKKATQLGDEINTGTVLINRCDYLHPALPWSGVKETGEGLSLSYLSFKQFSRIKSFNIGAPL